MSGGGSRVSIPAGVRPTIQNIKEIAGNHSDEEIYAMLKECGMDPNETAQKLLLQGLPSHPPSPPRASHPPSLFRAWPLPPPAQLRFSMGVDCSGEPRSLLSSKLSRSSLGFVVSRRRIALSFCILDASNRMLWDPFHEVKRKRDRRKENVREPADPRWRAGLQGRGGRGGRGNYSRPVLSGMFSFVLRFVLYRSVRAKKKEKKKREKRVRYLIFPSLPRNLSPARFVARGRFFAGGLPAPRVGRRGEKGKGNDVCCVVCILVTLSMFHCYLSDFGYRPTNSHCLLDAAAGRNLTSGKVNGVNQGSDKGITSSSSSTPDTEVKSATSILSSISGPTDGPSNIDHPISSQRSYASGVSGIAPREERFGVVTTKTGTSRLSPTDVKSTPTGGHSIPDSDKSSSNKAAAPVSEVYVPTSDPVLAPSLDAHNPAELENIKQVTGIQHSVVETDTSHAGSQHISGFNSSYMSGKCSSMSSPYMHGKVPMKPHESGSNELSEKSQVAPSSFSTATGSRPSSTYSNRSQQLSGLQKGRPFKLVNLHSSFYSAPVPNKEWKPKSTPVIASQASEMIETPDVSVAAEAVAESLPAPCSVASEVTTLKLEKQLEELKLSDRKHVIIPNHLQVSESERHGLSFGSFDPNFELNMGFANGPAKDMIDTPVSDSSQETEETTEQPSLRSETLSTNAAMLSTAGTTPLATQAAATMQGSVAIPQQPVPVFRQPAGLHISHYPPNYIPYNQYFSPFYVPPPTLHHFLSSPAFPQQPPTGSMFPSPGSANPATPVKYSLPQYKPGANIGNSTIVGMPAGYGMYNSTPAGYTPDAATSGNSTANDDLGSSQFKENNLCIPGQQVCSLYLARFYMLYLVYV
ncbi:hypothetical protein BHE74_00026098 [Ensete ventricosum]|nr:hypothetical protein BHE74_00026098 [Ensete ventricosum]